MSIEMVRIPAKPDHGGLSFSDIKLNWICPKCGGKRGEINTAISYDGSKPLTCHGWVNSCGHVDKYPDILEEANKNGLNS